MEFLEEDRYRGTNRLLINVLRAQRSVSLLMPELLGPLTSSVRRSLQSLGFSFIYDILTF